MLSILLFIIVHRSSRHVNELVNPILRSVMLFETRNLCSTLDFLQNLCIMCTIFADVSERHFFDFHLAYSHMWQLYRPSSCPLCSRGLVLSSCQRRACATSPDRGYKGSTGSLCVSLIGRSMGLVEACNSSLYHLYTYLYDLYTGSAGCGRQLHPYCYLLSKNNGVDITLHHLLHPLL